jgi:hypothetical protein
MGDRPRGLTALDRRRELTEQAKLGWLPESFHAMASPEALVTPCRSA